MSIFTTFRFEVVLTLDNPPEGFTNPICDAAFSRCDGLEASMEPFTYQEGGRNQRQYHRPGPVTYSQISLRRGMSDNLQLWHWFELAGRPGRKAAANGEITIHDASGTPQVTFMLKNCLPVRLRAPGLDAQETQIAIEELVLVCEHLQAETA